MRLTIPPLEIGPDDGFNDDKLGREEFGKSLMNLVTNVSDELVVGITAPFGEGKTTFAKMWQGMLRKDEFRTVYFDAFKNDFTDDVFTTITGEILKALSDKCGEPIPNDRIKDLKNAAVKFGTQFLLPTILNAGIKVASFGTIGKAETEAAKLFWKTFSDSASDAASNFVKEKLDACQAEVSAMDAFRTSLGMAGLAVREQTKKPLIIIIDELDRCKPTMAVEILEKIKHCFSVKNIVFVLVMNKQQLEAAIQSVYGSGIDANVYLQKFITVELRLPKRTQFGHDGDHRKYCQRLGELHEFNQDRALRHIPERMESLTWYFNLSLREMERCFANIVLCCSLIQNLEPLDSEIMILLVILKYRDPILYRRLGEGVGVLQDIESLIDIRRVKREISDTWQIEEIYYLFRYLLLDEESAQSLDEDDPSLKKWNGPQEFSYVGRRRLIRKIFCYLELVSPE